MFEILISVIFIEGVLNTLKSIINDKKVNYLLILSSLIGFLIMFIGGVRLLRFPLITDNIISGIAIGRISNYIADIIKLLNIFIEKNKMLITAAKSIERNDINENTR